jgi:23S rRNA G2445 N2-methylase RlmL
VEVKAPVRMFATAVPGMAELVDRELARAGVRVTGTGSDGRADIILFEALPSDVSDLRNVEDLFVEIGRTLRSEGDRPQWISNRIWKPNRFTTALAARGHSLPKTPTFRVIARVLQERSFLRTELRRALTGVVSREYPHWKQADPAQLEVWVSEYRPGRFVAGLRLTDVSTRQHGGRDTERAGALRPTVAAAMLDLVGDKAVADKAASAKTLAGEKAGTLLDPCCGSGTILAEARTRGWNVRGSDIDGKAVDTAVRNLGRDVPIIRGDARRLELPDGSVDACVSNFPFGRQYEVTEPMNDWVREVLAEMARITRPGGRVVVLAPKIPAPALPKALRQTERHAITLLGTRTAIWAFDRR